MRRGGGAGSERGRLDGGQETLAWTLAGAASGTTIGAAAKSKFV
jgi:hypothetical protein